MDSVLQLFGYSNNNDPNTKKTICNWVVESDKTDGWKIIQRFWPQYNRFYKGITLSPNELNCAKSGWKKLFLHAKDMNSLPTITQLQTVINNCKKCTLAYSDNTMIAIV
jgi:hypothetical protein